MINLAVALPYQLVPREQVHVIHLKAMRASRQAEWAKFQAFLGIVDDGRTTFPVANTAKVRRFRWVIEGIRKINSLIRGMGLPYMRIGLTNYLNARLVSKRVRRPISGNLRRQLEEYFEEDQKLLEQLGHHEAGQDVI